MLIKAKHDDLQIACPQINQYIFNQALIVDYDKLATFY